MMKLMMMKVMNYLTFFTTDIKQFFKKKEDSQAKFKGFGMNINSIKNILKILKLRYFFFFFEVTRFFIKCLIYKFGSRWDPMLKKELKIGLFLLFYLFYLLLFFPCSKKFSFFSFSSKQLSVVEWWKGIRRYPLSYLLSQLLSS